MTTLSSETFAFLTDLSTPRDKPWFDANRARYETHLLEPMRALVTDIGLRLKGLIPDLECRPQINKTLTRINRDMRFARGGGAYKDHMIALFYREGRKKSDPQLFIGVQPKQVWVGLYLSPTFLGPDSPMARAVSERPSDVVALGKEAGIGTDLRLGSCRRYGEIEKSMNGDEAEQYIAGPHLCALRVFTPDVVAADPDVFMEESSAILERLVPLWKTYLEGF